MSQQRAYVKLGETTHNSEENEITPGELNQAIDIDKLTARTCEQCGQTLPPTYTPPADEDWTTGIFGCLDDTDSCVTGLFCPCVLFGRNVAAFNEDITPEKACVGHVICIEGGITLAALTAACNGVIQPDTVCLLTEGLLFAWWVCAIYTGMGRQVLQRKYHLKDSPCDPCMVHCLLHWCAICQEHREMHCHLSDGLSMEDTVTTPPAVQEMNNIDEKEEATTSSSQEDAAATSSQEIVPTSSQPQDVDGQNDLQLQAV